MVAMDGEMYAKICILKDFNCNQMGGTFFKTFSSLFVCLTLVALVKKATISLFRRFACKVDAFSFQHLLKKYCVLGESPCLWCKWRSWLSL